MEISDSVVFSSREVILNNGFFFSFEMGWGKRMLEGYETKHLFLPVLSSFFFAGEGGANWVVDVSSRFLCPASPNNLFLPLSLLSFVLFPTLYGRCSRGRHFSHLRLLLLL